MASSKEYVNFILDQLSDLEEITARSMMGEYIIYYRGKLAAYLCDDRLLVKPLDSSMRLLPDAPYELPYDGAKKEMILVEDVDDRELLTELFLAMYEELPEPKPKKKKKQP
ncbi:TfoX/Sxy family protein [Anaerolentibacter hominis]|uniref:TfoX/Sxy family protein n=1 Tax=Anaerolentibacter hominis TaxID=3079009 RepID=UPI0031B8AEF9